MNYIIDMKAQGNTQERTSIIVFEPISVGSKIGWGADERQPDGIKYWTVTECTEVNA